MEIDPALLQRIIDRLFPADDRVTVAGLLDQYGVEAYEREAVRVRIAMLKLCAGSLDKLRDLVPLAKRDYRDVLAWAEYPAELRLPTWTMDQGQQAQIRSADKLQYREWLEKLGE